MSKHKEMLSGFPFSSKQVLESVLRVPVETSLDRATGEAQIDIPILDTATYLYNFRNLPYYRIIANLGGVCYMMMTEDGRKYTSPYDGYCDKQLGVYESEWLPAVGVNPAMHITLQYPLHENPIPDEVTLLLCIGIEFDKVGGG